MWNFVFITLEAAYNICGIVDLLTCRIFHYGIKKGTLKPVGLVVCDPTYSARSQGFEFLSERIFN